eukprot:3166142-Rhodomonas_salina.2
MGPRRVVLAKARVGSGAGGGEQAKVASPSLPPSLFLSPSPAPSCHNLCPPALRRARTLQRGSRARCGRQRRCGGLGGCSGSWGRGPGAGRWSRGEEGQEATQRGGRRGGMRFSGSRPRAEGARVCRGKVLTREGRFRPA